jgi:predicted site-specific integrase-resolvase
MEIQMQIGDLAKRLGVSASKIRHLEAKGLLRPTQGHSNRYRMYDEDAASIGGLNRGVQAPNAMAAGFVVEPAAIATLLGL